MEKLVKSEEHAEFRSQQCESLGSDPRATAVDEVSVGNAGRRPCGHCANCLCRRSANLKFFQNKILFFKKMLIVVSEMTWTTDTDPENKAKYMPLSMGSVVSAYKKAK